MTTMRRRKKRYRDVLKNVCVPRNKKSGSKPQEAIVAIMEKKKMKVEPSLQTNGLGTIHHGATKRKKIPATGRRRTRKMKSGGRTTKRSEL